MSAIRVGTVGNFATMVPDDFIQTAGYLILAVGQDGEDVTANQSGTLEHIVVTHGTAVHGSVRAVTFTADGVVTGVSGLLNDATPGAVVVAPDTLRYPINIPVLAGDSLAVYLDENDAGSVGTLLTALGADQIGAAPSGTAPVVGDTIPSLSTGTGRLALIQATGTHSTPPGPGSGGTPWRVTLGQSTVCGGDCPDDQVDACLTVPPDGTGVPSLRTTDQTYPQRDGVDHFSDWYEPRILTLTALVGGDGCDCGDARDAAASLMNAWSRRCDDTELVLWPDCDSTGFTELAPNGEFPDNVDGWTSAEGTITHETTITHVPPGSAKFTATATTAFAFVATNPIRVHASIVYQFEAWNYLAVGHVSTPHLQLAIQWLAEDGSPVGDFVLGPALIASSASWDRVGSGPLVARAPVGAFGATIGVLSTDTITTGDIIYFDSITFHETGRETVGPYGIIGRPRVATLAWRRGKKNVADATLRFDAVDHRLYVLDANGAPGSGSICTSGFPLNQFAVLDPIFTTAYPLDEPASDEGVFKFAGASGNDVEFRPSEAARGFPPATYTGIGLGAPGPSTYFFGPRYTTVSPDFFQGVLNSATEFTWMTWYKSDSPGTETVIAEFNSPLYYMTTRRYHHNGTDYAFSPATTALLESGDWHHFAIATLNGAGTKIYVDAVLTDTLAFTGVVGTIITRAYISPGQGFFSQMIIINTRLPQAKIEGYAQIMVSLPIEITGTECAQLLITFTGGDLDFPRVYFDNGTYVGVDNIIRAGQTFTIDTATGKGTLRVGTAEIDQTRFIVGDPFICLCPGTHQVALRTHDTATDNDGTVEICYRPSVVSA